ncbi:hypothetical protein DYB37_011366 [Aphanomyces astaci]|uniref:PDZ domain-containing protein n=1 Tax=Aphanomyces astaci TaxID=112090 RepID=A0A3R7ADV4_APHAT|nr:hypothetical protein DYB35_012090 [Aphanomyces astaci]RHZ25758.1 hypothetical protein DYB37_011366 [Aphanomyces astaci]
MLLVISRLHDTAASVSNTGIKPWECTEHAKYLAGDVGLARKDEEYARAMKEVKDYVMLAPEINPNPPYVPSKASTPSPADSPPQEAPPSPPLPLPSQLTTESTPPTLQSSDSRCSHPPNTNTNPSANSSPSSSGVSSEPPKVVDHKAPVSLNGLGAAVAVASIPQGDNVSPTCGEDGGSSVKTEAQADAASPVREGVAWAFLNDQLWWPVLVCGFKLDDNTPGMLPSEPSRNQVVDVYYFGRKHFGNIDSTVLKPWNGPEHTSFIYDQSMLETKSKAFVSAFADAVAEAGDFASVLHTLSDQPANSPATAPPIPSAEPPRKKQALLTLPTRSNQLISEYVMLRNVVQAVVPAWKVASATMTLENLAEFTKSLQIVLNQLHAIMRKIIDNPRTIVTPLVFVSTYHSAVMCVWTMVLSVSLKNAAPASRSDTHFMHTCLHCFLESVDGVYKPLLHSSVVHRCLQFAHIATQYARAPLAPEVQRARAWMHDFFQLYLAKPPTYDKCRALVADTTNGLGRLPVPVTRELAKLTALRHGFEHPAVDVEPAADNQQEASMSFHDQSLGLHIGETQNGLRVLGMTPTAPEPTKRAVQSGTIQRGDVIVAVNSIPIAQFGGFRELCAVVASTARPIVLTFRRRPVATIPEFAGN